MADVLDLTPVDWCGEQVQSFAEAFYEATFDSPALAEVFSIVTGIVAKKQIVILGFMDIVGRKKTVATCAPKESDRKIRSKQKLWDPEWIEDRFVECWKNLLEKFTVWGLNVGIKKPDLTGTDFANFLEEAISSQIKEAIYRIAFFGDKDAEFQSDGGLIADELNGIPLDIDYFTPIDGLWKQFYAIVAANPEQYTRIDANYRGLATPAVAVLTPSEAGGTLAAGTYYIKVAAINENGVSIAGPESNAVIAGPTGSISVAYTAIPGATGYRVYVGTASGVQTGYFTDAASPLIITTLVGAIAGTPPTTSTAYTAAGQCFTAQDTQDQVITNILQGMIDNADTRLFQDGQDAKFWVTRSVAQQYMRERKLPYPNIPLAYDRTEGGFDVLRVDGIELFILDFEDRMIKQFFSDGANGSFQPHRIYYASKLNIQLGVENEASLDEVEAFYDQKDKQYYIDLGWSMDAKIIEDEMAAFAY